MNIKSKFKDYYDHVGHIYGSHNEGHVYLRTTEFCPLGNEPGPVLAPEPTPNVDTKHVSTGILYFCGKYYPVIRIIEMEECRRSYLTGWRDTYTRYFWDTLDMEDYLEHNLIENVQDFNLLINFNHRYEFRHRSTLATTRWFFNLGQDTLERKFLEKIGPTWVDKQQPIGWAGFTSVDKKVSEPTFLYNRCVNPCLAEISFIKRLSAEQAYQELEMFLGQRDQENADPNSGIDDKYIKAGKGYDCMSFRKRGPNSSCKKG